MGFKTVKSFCDGGVPEKRTSKVEGPVTKMFQSWFSDIVQLVKLLVIPKALQIVLSDTAWVSNKMLYVQYFHILNIFQLMS